MTTDIPLSYLGGQPFSLNERRHFVLSWGAPVEEPLASLASRFLEQTVRYWRRWVKHCNVPALFQQEVIRSALALKLHCFEDTGAIVAAMTTSVPECPGGSGRTWDYRFCWLRDAYYAVDSLRLLGHFEEREAFIGYLLDVAGASQDLQLAPVYRIDGRMDLTERVLPDWAGFEGERPVRVGNGAAVHVQNDVFGEMVLALTPVFLDDRFSAERTPAALKLLEALARKAIAVVGIPDAGIWEFRTTWQPQTFSALMCWAAADRMARVASRFAPSVRDEFAAAAQRIQTGHLGALLESCVWRLRRYPLRGCAGCVSATDGAASFSPARRRQAPRHNRRNPADPGPERMAHALRHRRRLRDPERVFHALQLLDGGGPGHHRTRRRSATTPRHHTFRAAATGTALGRL